MNKSWYKAYYRVLDAIVVARGNSGVVNKLDAAEIVLRAGTIADASEAYLTKRGEEEDAADEAKRQAWEKEATEKVLRIGRYSIEGFAGPDAPRDYLTVSSVRGGRVYFADNLRNIEFADLVDVADETGITPAPLDSATGSGSGAGAGRIQHFEGSANSPTFVVGSGGAGGDSSPPALSIGGSNGPRS